MIHLGQNINFNALSTSAASIFATTTNTTTLWGY